jgi:hypothetical protein
MIRPISVEIDHLPVNVRAVRLRAAITAELISVNSCASSAPAISPSVIRLHASFPWCAEI